MVDVCAVCDLRLEVYCTTLCPVPVWVEIFRNSSKDISHAPAATQERHARGLAQVPKISPTYRNFPRYQNFKEARAQAALRYYFTAHAHTRRRPLRSGMPADSPKYQNSPRDTNTSDGHSAGGPGIRFCCPTLTLANGHTGAACPRTRQVPASTCVQRTNAASTWKK